MKGHASQSLSIGLEVSGIKIEAAAFLGIGVTSIGPHGTVALVLEPGKLVANLDFFCERGAGFGSQGIAFGQAEAVFGTSDLDVTCGREKSVSEFDRPVCAQLSFLLLFPIFTHPNFIVVLAIEIPLVLDGGEFTIKGARMAFARESLGAFASNAICDNVLARALLQKGGLGVRNTVHICVEGATGRVGGHSRGRGSQDSSEGKGELHCGYVDVEWIE